MTLSTRFKSFHGSLGELSDSYCSICLENYSSLTPVVVHENTKFHPYHEKCLASWVKYNSNCPECRRKITHINDVKIQDSKLFSPNVPQIVCLSMIVGFLFSNFCIATIQGNYSECELKYLSVSCITHVALQLIGSFSSLVVGAMVTEMFWRRYVQ